MNYQAYRCLQRKTMSSRRGVHLQEREASASAFVDKRDGKKRDTEWSLSTGSPFRRDSPPAKEGDGV